MLYGVFVLNDKISQFMVMTQSLLIMRISVIVTQDLEVRFQIHKFEKKLHPKSWNLMKLFICV